MKKYLFSILILAMSSCAVKVDELRLMDGITTHGRIKKLISNSYEFSDSAKIVIKKLKSTLLAKYDNNGRLMYQIDSNYLKERTSKDSTCFYYNKNNLLEKTITYSNYTDSKFIVAFKYNEKNQKTEEITGSDNKINYTHKFTYDKKGNKSTEARYDESSIQTFKDSFIYNYKKKYYETFSFKDMKKGSYKVYFNIKGQLYKLENYSSKSELQSKSLHIFDKYGNQIKVINSDNQGKITGTSEVKFTYDKKGNWLTRSSYYKNGKMTRYAENAIEY